MIQTIKLLETIKETKGTNDKVAKLRDESRKCSARNLEILNLTLDLLYNPTSSTNIAKKKIEKEVPKEELKYTDTKDFLIWLKNECSGKDTDIAQCQAFINSLDEEYRQTMKEIITQSFSCNLDYKLINRAYGYAFIKVVAPMLAYSWDKMNDKDKKEKYYVSEKLDGTRVLIFVDNFGNKTAYSRNGFELEGYNDFLNSLTLEKGYVYDGELLPSNVDGLESKDQYKAIMKITRTKGEKDKSKMRYNIFDMIPIEEYEQGEPTQPYAERREMMNKLIFNTPYQRLIPTIDIIDFNTDFEKLSNLLDKVVSQGSEGLMINKSNAKYELKRCRGIFKLKKFHTCDLRVLRVEEGDGRFKDMLGNLIVDYKGFELGVGSGFSDEQRSYYWNHQDEIVGTIVEISYFEETKNQDGGLSMRFPIFLQVRKDKNDISYE